MTVKELKQALLEFDDETEIMIPAGMDFMTPELLQKATVVQKKDKRPPYPTWMHWDEKRGTPPDRYEQKQAVICLFGL
jgi:hypothetical protein